MTCHGESCRQGRAVCTEGCNAPASAPTPALPYHVTEAPGFYDTRTLELIQHNSDGSDPGYTLRNWEAGQNEFSAADDVPDLISMGIALAFGIAALLMTILIPNLIRH